MCADTETTGLDPTRDRVIELAMVVVRKGKLAESWSGRMNPGEDALARMTEEARQVHQIEAEALEGEPDFEERWNEAEAWIEAHAHGLPIVAHNAEFDAGMVAAELARIGREAHPWAQAERWVDTLHRSREEFGDSGGAHNLDALAKRMKIPKRAQGAAHNALGDAELLAKCWCRWGAPAMGDLFEEPTQEDAAETRQAQVLAWEGREAQAGKWRAFWEEALG